MRRLLLVIVTALLLGASSIWLMQQDSGYILFSLNNTTVEMTAWVGLLLFLLVTGVAVWLILLVRWLSDGGGLRQWWGSRRSERHVEPLQMNSAHEEKQTILQTKVSSQ